MKALFISSIKEDLSIEYISAALKRNDIETEILIDPLMDKDIAANSLIARLVSNEDGWIDILKDSRANLIYISPDKDNYKRAFFWAETAKKYLSAKTVFGGHYASVMPARFLSESAVDFVCVGEPDLPITELAEGKDPFAISNIWGKKNGRAFCNVLRPLITDLSAVPFADKEIYYSRYPFAKYGYLISCSRGCPMDCAHCKKTAYKNIYGKTEKFSRLRNAANVLEELEFAREKYKPEFIHFADERLNFNKQWFEEFCAGYTARIGLKFSCKLHPDTMDTETAASLKQAGCFSARIGVHTMGDEKRNNVLNYVSKQDKISKAIKFLRAENIFVTCDNILGFPNETSAELGALCQFYQYFTPDRNKVFHLQNHQKTPMSRKTADASSAAPPAVAHKFAGILMFLPIMPSRITAFFIRKKNYKWFPFPDGKFTRLIAFALNSRPRYDFGYARFIKAVIFFVLNQSPFGKLRRISK